MINRLRVLVDYCHINKILKTGGERGNPECFKTMWDIYAGNTVLDVRHEGNAELCFQWFMKAAGDEAESVSLLDYLYHAYDNLGGEDSYRIDTFPGKFASVVVEILATRVRAAFQRIHEARIAGVDIQQTDSQLSTTAGDRGEIIDFIVFTSTCVRDADQLMKSVMVEVDLSDLQYCFSTAKNPGETVALYARYLPTRAASALTVLGSIDTQTMPKVEPVGFFRKWFSHYFFSPKANGHPSVRPNISVNADAQRRSFASLPSPLRRSPVTFALKDFLPV